MLNFETYEEDIAMICRMTKVRKLDIFGSALGDRFTPGSDIDVLVDFDRTEDGNLFNRYFDLKEGLENLFKRKVDVVVEKAVKNPYFRESFEKSKRTVYES